MVQTPKGKNFTLFKYKFLFIMIFTPGGLPMRFWDVPISASRLTMNGITDA